MASIEEQLKNVRTMEDIVNLLSILFTNLNNQNELYYDMFLNPEPMDLELERYDENGELVTVTLANRAKDIIRAYTGEGNPNGKITARIGALYIDLVNGSLYYKASGSDSYGWYCVWSQFNLRANEDYLTPTGNGSQVTDINANNIGTGTLSVSRGGTGTGSISGLVKGNGTNAFTAAADGTDYLGPNSMVGMISHFAAEDIPTGWLLCNGAQYNIGDYSRLYARIGSKYNIKSGDLAKTFYAYKSGSNVIYLTTTNPSTLDVVYSDLGVVQTNATITAIRPSDNSIAVTVSGITTVYTYSSDESDHKQYGKYYAYKNGEDVFFVDTAVPTTLDTVYENIGEVALLKITEVGAYSSTGASSLTFYDGETTKTYNRDTTSDVIVTEYADPSGEGVTAFRIPNLVNKYIKGGIPIDVGTTGEAHVQAHNHFITGNTLGGTAHSHGVGTYQITGWIPASEGVFKSWFRLPSDNNAFSHYQENVVSGSSPNDKFDNDVWMLNAYNGHGFLGASATESTHTHGFQLASTTVGSGKNEVDHTVMLPVIKY